MAAHDSDECVSDPAAPGIVFFGAAQLVADRAVVSVRARIDFSIAFVRVSTFSCN